MEHEAMDQLLVGGKEARNAKEWLPRAIAGLNFAASTGCPILLVFEDQREERKPRSRRRGRAKRQKREMQEQEEELQKWGELLLPDVLQKRIGDMLRENVFPPVLLQGDGSTSLPVVQAVNPTIGGVSILVAPTAAWPRAFCRTSWLQVRCGPSASMPQIDMWRDALAENVDWSLPKVAVAVREGVALQWRELPSEATDIEHKSRVVWPVSLEAIGDLVRNNVGQLLRGCSSFTLTLGVDDASRLPMGLLLDCTPEEIQAAVATELDAQFPPLSLEEAVVTVTPVALPDRQSLRIIAETSSVCPTNGGEYFRETLKGETPIRRQAQLVLVKDVNDELELGDGGVVHVDTEQETDEEGEAAACAAELVKKADGPKTNERGVDAEDGDESESEEEDSEGEEEGETEEVTWQYSMAYAAGGAQLPLTVELPPTAVLLQTYIVQIKVTHTAKGDAQRAAYMHSPRAAATEQGVRDRTAYALPVVVQTAEGLRVGPSVPFSPLLFHLRSRPRPHERLRAAAALPFCYKAVLFDGELPWFPEVNHFKTADLSATTYNDVAQAALDSRESLTLFVVVLRSGQDWQKAVAFLLGACVIISHLVQLILVIDDSLAQSLPTILSQLQRPSIQLLDVGLLTPRTESDFPAEAVALGFHLFTGRDEAPAHDDALLGCVQEWLVQQAPLPADAFVCRLVPRLNGQVLQLVHQISRLLRSTSGSVEQMVVSKLFRCSGTTTLLRHAAALAAAQHEDLLFVDSRDQSEVRWTSELVTLLDSFTAPVVVVAEDCRDVALLLRGAPRSAVIVLTSTLVVARALSSESPVFVASPLVDAHSVPQVCDALAAAIQDDHKTKALEDLKVLAHAREPLHRHLVVFLVAALRGYPALCGIRKYVEVELTPCLESSTECQEFLSALAFVGTFATPSHRFLTCSPVADTLANVMRKGSLLHKEGDRAAAWHPWVAREMLQILEPTALQRILEVGLVGAMEAIDSKAETKEVLQHLLFCRADGSFSRLMLACRDMLQDGGGLQFPFEALANQWKGTEKEKEKFKGHLHLLWSRMLRHCKKYEEAKDHARLAIKLDGSFSAEHNSSILALHTASGSRKDLTSALTDLALLYSRAEAASRVKIRKTARKFIKDLPKKEQKDLLPLFDLKWEQRVPATSDDRKESVTVINRAAHNMPAMSQGELDQLLASAKEIEG